MQNNVIYDIDISLVIITWNAKHFLEKCLKSVFEKNNGFDFELIIIDNNSEDGTIEFVESNYPDAKLIKNSENRGVAPARNQGLKIAKGKYILILDVDTELVTDNAFEIMVNYMNNNKIVGIMGAKLIFPSGEIQYTCRKFPSIFDKFFYRIIPNSRFHEKHFMMKSDHNQILKVDYIIGAFQFIRHELIKKIGLYDENIFYGPEDIDYCLRAKKNGYEVIYFPEIVLYHFYQRITKKIFTKITLKHFMGLLHYFNKHKYLIYPKY